VTIAIFLLPLGLYRGYSNEPIKEIFNVNITGLMFYIQKELEAGQRSVKGGISAGRCEVTEV
jgi:hypothetical protein